MAFSVIWPTKSHTINSHYSADGSGRSNGKPHKGTDIHAALGDPIYAAAVGTVERAEWHYSWGNYVKIDHGIIDGIHYHTLYAHNSELLVSVGQTVKQGQQIAKAGSTGQSTGPHCHFEIYKDGVRVNPEPYLGIASTGNYTDATSSTMPSGYSLEYDKWTGHGTIKSDYTPLCWFDSDGNIVSKWKDTKGTERIFYGMVGEWFTFLGKVKDHYYGYAYGICQSRIKCVVPVSSVTNINGRATGTKGTINAGGQVMSNTAASSGTITGNIITIPEGLGTYATREFSTEGYKNFNWGSGTAQRRVWQAWKDKGCPTVKGFAAIDGKILIACTSTFGNVGDNVTWEFSNGDTLDTIIGDLKSQKYTSYDHNPANQWGHDNGKCVLEFCGVPKGIKGYNNPYLYFGWTRVVRAAKHGHYI